MTKELYEKLIPFEEKLHTAYYNDFVRLSDQKMKEELAALHMEAFGNGGKILGGCNRCVINALKNLGREYFAFKKQMLEEEKLKQVGEELTPKPQVVETEEVKTTEKKTATKKATNKTKKK